MRKPTPSPQRGSIHLYPTGIETAAPNVNLPPSKRGTKRGEIKGWSKHSRSRFRRWLLTREPIGEVYEYNVTLTVPGPPLTVDEMRTLWKNFSRSLQKSGRSAVWRLEVQKRDAVHWHCIVHTPYHVIGDMPPKVDSAFNLPALWEKAIDTLGPCIHTGKDWKGNPGTYEWPSRSDIPWAFDLPERAIGKPDAHIIAIVSQLAPQSDHKRWAWRRYMQDHASKAKQEQIPQGFGRHWGVIGKDLYGVVLPSAMEKLSDGQFYAVIRWMQRLISGTVKEDKAPFGRKRGIRRHRGTKGRSCWFSNPEPVDRMIALAKTIRADDPAGI